MKRKLVRKLILHRETLHRLEPSFLVDVAGARVPSGVTDCATKCASVCCPNDGGNNTFTVNTFGVCSGGCATGGACTVTCSACTSGC